jgi:excinuclease ABC subunit B
MTIPVDAKGRRIPGTEEDLPVLIKKLTADMKQAARDLEFEKAATLRDEIKELNKILLEMC